MSLDPSPSPPDPAQKPRIVALGASAGGLEALRLFFSHLPPDTGLCFLALQHLDPERNSSLPEILSRHTTLPVRLVRDQDEPAPDSVLILPPGMVAGLEHGRLRLSPQGRERGLALPIDRFLLDLAAEEGERACAVILSGAPELDPLFAMLHERFGIDFRSYKPSTVSRRIERRATIRQCPDLGSYARLLQEEPRELDQLCHDLLIGVTSFFRDEPAFRFLEQRVIPGLLESVGEREVRVWVPACATGEEVYSLAMLFREAAELQGREPRVRLFATDVHQRSLATAAQGLYPPDAEGLTEARRRWFTQEAGGLRVRPELRRMVVFAGHNLIQDPPFTRMDLVVCRNLLIYLRPEAQSRILHVFHFALRRGGVLFLGPSESLAGLEEEFEPLDRHWKIFAKRREVCLPGRLHWPARFRPEPSPESAPDLDLGGLLERCGRDRVLALEQMRSFVEDLPRRRAELELALERGDLRATARLARNLGETARAAGAPRLAGLAARLERSASRPDPRGAEAAAALWRALLPDLARTEAGMAGVLAGRTEFPFLGA